jgi:hypothetical protein
MFSTLGNFRLICVLASYPLTNLARYFGKQTYQIVGTKKAEKFVHHAFFQIFKLYFILFSQALHQMSASLLPLPNQLSLDHTCGSATHHHLLVCPLLPRLFGDHNILKAEIELPKYWLRIIKRAQFLLLL